MNLFQMYIVVNLCGQFMLKVIRAEAFRVRLHFPSEGKEKMNFSVTTQFGFLIVIYIQ